MVILAWQQTFVEILEADSFLDDHSAAVMEATINPAVRPRRDRQLSAQALRNIAAADPSPPDGGDDPEDAESVNLTFIIDDIWKDYISTCYHLNDDTVPVTMIDAFNSPTRDKWIKGLTSEVISHINNNTMTPPVDPSSLPPGVKPIPLDVVLKVKRNGIYKVRAVVKGWKMRAGIDFNDTFAPVPAITVLRILFALSAKYNWKIKAGDVHTAFLLSPMDSDVWVIVPNWFVRNPSGAETGYSIRKLLRGVPGIPQGPRLFHKKES